MLLFHVIRSQELNILQNIFLIVVGWYYFLETTSIPLCIPWTFMIPKHFKNVEVPSKYLRILVRQFFLVRSIHARIDSWLHCRRWYNAAEDYALFSRASIFHLHLRRSFTYSVNICQNRSSVTEEILMQQSILNALFLQRFNFSSAFAKILIFFMEKNVIFICGDQSNFMPALASFWIEHFFHSRQASYAWMCRCVIFSARYVFIFRYSTVVRK